MRIAFDHQAFCRQTAGGISRYYCRLADELSRQDQQVGIFAPVNRNVYLKDLPNDLVHGFSVKNYPVKTAGVCVAANGIVARSMIRRWNPDVVHETYFHKQGACSDKTPSVITVFDMIGELDALQQSKQPVDFKNTDKYKAVQRADHVICISEHTRQDLVRLFDVQENKLSVIHLGCDFALQEPVNDSVHDSVRVLASDSVRNASNDSVIKLNPKASRPFLLYVGLRDGYKNFAGMSKAIAASSKLMSDFDLVAFGGGAFTRSEQHLLTSLGFGPQQFRQVSGSDQDLNLLYRQAAAFIYPSTYEGFGLPPLEAMARQCPVVSSHTSSMPEVIGNAAEFFNPNETDSIKFAIEQVVFSEDRKQDLIQKGNQRVAEFAWSACAEKTLSVYIALVNITK
jgi:glycosyltransferase involved in cell wall biosynthesis